jgi:hypothetical protein
MATLREYYETDFNRTVGVVVKLGLAQEHVEATVNYDFQGYMAYMACYIPEAQYSIELINELIIAIEQRTMKVLVDGDIRLPLANSFHGQLQIATSKGVEVLGLYHGEAEWVSTKTFTMNQRLFLYCEKDLDENLTREIKALGKKSNLDIQIRSLIYMNIRSAQEKPLAFICHDSRDKKEVARPIALNLSKNLCPVWYDEYSLNVGENLRDSIEQGLKESQKCILILSQYFLSNKGWTKKEFDSIFTREIIEEKKLVLPVWHDVTKKEVYDYCPSLLNTFGLNWEELGENVVCSKLSRAIKTSQK